MCTRKIEIQLKPTEAKNLWKMPKQMISIYHKNGTPYMMAKCGKCDECRLERVRNWTYKIWLENLNHKQSCFITLTYADNEKGKNLNKHDLVKFIKRLRKKYTFKYFAVGEYGEKKGRAHYHIIILGWTPPDTRLMHGAKSKKGKLLYTSQIVHDTWGMGRITIQPFGKDEISYITLYTNKNKLVNKYYNGETLADKRHILNNLKLKYGLMIKTLLRNGNIKYTKIKLLKDMSSNQYKQYKKEYNKIHNNLVPKKQTEFNIYSKGMGYKTFIDKEYYKYDLILDDFRYEIPKDFLIKAYEKENEIIKNYIVDRLLERKEYAEDNYIDTKNKEQMKEIRIKEEAKDNDIKNRLKLNGTLESRTF